MRRIELMDESFFKHLVHTYDGINDTKKNVGWHFFHYTKTLESNFSWIDVDI